MLLNKKWKRKIIQTKFVSERMITTKIKCDQYKIELNSVYSPTSGHIEKMCKNIETHWNNKKHI